jgi:hypothetical protein
MAAAAIAAESPFLTNEPGMLLKTKDRNIWSAGVDPDFSPRRGRAGR